MSEIKYRLRKLLPSLSEQSKACRDREIKQRLYVIKAIAKSERTITAACEFRGLGKDKFYEWANRLLASENISALKAKSRKPKTSPNQTKPEIEKKIIRRRNKSPFEGPERISIGLEDEFGVVIPPSTVYAVLVRNKLISEEYKKQRTKKHTKRYRSPIPGYLQMDFKYVPYLINNEQYYQLSVVDHCTTWRMIRVYPQKNEEAVKKFLEELNLICPFPIFQIQTDNDAAFTDKYSVGLGIRPTGAHPMDEWCSLYGCRHKLIPIGQKELNGKVENTHKFDDREFYSVKYCRTLLLLEGEIEKYNLRWNEKRKTKSLGWRTPYELLCDVKTTILALLLFCKKDEVQQQTVPKTPENKIEKQKIKSKTKQQTDRYLAWMAWEASQYPKFTIMAVSGMSLISSQTKKKALLLGSRAIF
ncbi:hypothetical protein EB118_23680 [bacterium]|nr:hypothetical protein [bacterium]